MLYALALSLPAVIPVGYEARIIVLFSQAILATLFLSAKNFHKINLLAASTIIFTVFLIIFSNFLGTLVGRNTNFVLALSDLAPLMLFVLIPKLNWKILLSVVFLTNLAALALNIIKATYIIYPNSFMQLIFESYQIASNFGFYYWRFVGLAGQAGQAGLHALLSLICVFLYIRHHASSKVIFFLSMLIIANLFFASSRIAILFVFLFLILYVLISGSRKVKYMFLVFLIIAPFLFSFLILPNLTQQYIDSRITNISTGGYRFALLLASVEYAAQTFPFGLGSQKEYLMQYGDLGIDLDITLRNPDGYFSVVLIRYGFIGMSLFVGMFLYKAALAARSREYLKSGSIILILGLSVVDPIFITPINVVLIASIIKGINLNV